MYLRCREKLFYMFCFIRNLKQTFPALKQVWKSFKNLKRYRRELGGLVFWTWCISTDNEFVVCLIFDVMEFYYHAAACNAMHSIANGFWGIWIHSKTADFDRYIQPALPICCVALPQLRCIHLNMSLTSLYQSNTNDNNNNPLYSFVDKPLRYASQQLTHKTTLINQYWHAGQVQRTTTGFSAGISCQHKRR